jgi:hypothetical protein
LWDLQQTRVDYPLPLLDEVLSACDIHLEAVANPHDTLMN